jgi:hypothetical protein
MKESSHKDAKKYGIQRMGGSTRFRASIDMLFQDLVIGRIPPLRVLLCAFASLRELLNR